MYLIDLLLFSILNAFSYAEGRKIFLKITQLTWFVIGVIFYWRFWAKGGVRAPVAPRRIRPLPGLQSRSSRKRRAFAWYVQSFCICPPPPVTGVDDDQRSPSSVAYGYGLTFWGNRFARLNRRPYGRITFVSSFVLTIGS